jgi:hypothetical protein
VAIDLTTTGAARGAFRVEGHGLDVLPLACRGAAAADVFPGAGEVDASASGWSSGGVSAPVS